MKAPSEIPDCSQAPLSRQLSDSFARLYRELRQETAPSFHIRFYPYAGVKSTVRLREGRVFIRISDILETAPLLVLEAVLAILLCKLFRHRLPESYRKCYREYVSRSTLRGKARAVRRERGRKELTSSAGNVYDLTQIFEQLNQEYFQDRVKIRFLSWSLRRSRRVLGHFDPAHNAIVINRRLDNRRVPSYVIRFLLYHEMLHADLGTTIVNGRCHCHHPIFKKAERQFREFRRARHFIDTKLCTLA